jgi:hypothetical protein
MWDARGRERSSRLGTERICVSARSCTQTPSVATARLGFGNLLTNYSRLHPVTLKHATLNTTLTYSSNVLDLHLQITSMRIAERRN